MPNTTTEKLINVPCKVSLSSTIKFILVVPKIDEMELPEGLETVNTSVNVKPGSNHWLKTPVLSNSKHDTILQKIINFTRFLV